MEGVSRWAGKVAVVTGASSGIGRAVAIALAGHGVVVVGLGRREKMLKEIAKSTGGAVHAMKCDLSVEQDITRAFEEIDKTFGSVDVLVNCAGYLKHGRLAGNSTGHKICIFISADGQTSEWRTTMDINVMAVCQCAREAIRIMEKNSVDGHIININSVTGHQVPQTREYSFGLYYASKHAVTALTETLRVELQDSKNNIKVTSISPGSVNTDMVRRVVAEIQKKEFDESEPLGERPSSFLDAKDVADAVVYVLSTPRHVQVKELIIEAVSNK